jgi:hypothetical protein
MQTRGLSFKDSALFQFGNFSFFDVLKSNSLTGTSLGMFLQWPQGALADCSCTDDKCSVDMVHPSYTRPSSFPELHFSSAVKIYNTV